MDDTAGPSFPPTPSISEASSELLDTGHLWLFELVDGSPLCFQMDETGLLRYGHEDRWYAGLEHIPAPIRAACHTVESHLNRDALFNALSAVSDLVFVGRATYYRTMHYDWGSLPAFLGYDIYTHDEQRWLRPDEIVQVYTAIGLAHAPIIKKEYRARDFDPRRFDIPRSAYGDTAAYGILIRNKAGGRAVLYAEHSPESCPWTGPPDQFVADFLTPQRINRIVDEPERQIDDIVLAMYREATPLLEGPLRSEMPAIREAIADTLGKQR